VGTVDGMAGINAGGNSISLDLQQRRPDADPGHRRRTILQVRTSAGGMTLNNAGNQVGAFTATNERYCGRHGAAQFGINAQHSPSLVQYRRGPD
jgi:predicted transglutaminase-like cysteine proteinase